MYGCCGSPNTSAAAPRSTIVPRYMTATSCAMCRTTSRSWEMNRYATPSSDCRSASRFRICARIDTSSADTASSHTMSFGRSASARAMPTRWHCPPDSSCRCRDPCSADSPTRSSSRATSASSRSRGTIPGWTRQPSAMTAATVIRGFSDV
ncbi:hypothetical protein LUX33_02175 [Actinomadura madurae]|nr:hypothetical protein [Actinomadura madurae]MCP9947394.1 hypothetical protein [Actinomadura madurae]MCP9976633.1 hypothetical protein [Actinomadura madurae]